VAPTRSRSLAFAPEEPTRRPSALADDTISLAALRQAAIRGRLNASVDAHGRWRSNRHAARQYMGNKYRRA
jgi:hypothetical protein